MAKKNVPRRGQSFRPANAKYLFEQGSEQPDNEWQNLEIVKQGRERGKEDYGRDYPKNEDEAVAFLINREIPEEEIGSAIGELCYLNKEI
ncbi:MAG: hypothetical protein Kapaf2KO_15860 [Candidatus Kapaibacteriales bacterium]